MPKRTPTNTPDTTADVAGAPGASAPDSPPPADTASPAEGSVSELAAIVDLVGSDAPADKVRALLEMAGRDEIELRLGRELVALLSEHAGERGESEGAADALRRIIRERDEAGRALTIRDIELHADDPDRFGEVLTRVAGERVSGEPRHHRIAMAKRAVNVYLRGGLTSIKGGDFVEGCDVAEVASDTDNFEIIEVEGDAEREHLMRRFRDEIESARRVLRSMGHHVVADGEKLPGKL